MDAYTFWKQHKTPLVKQLCKIADTTWPYYIHIMHGRSRPSVDLARAMIKASEALVKDERLRLDLDGLLPPKPKRKSKQRQKASQAVANY